MQRLTAFNFVTLDGYFQGPNADTSWHRHGAEQDEYAAEALTGGGTLLFGRVTYEMMAGYWTSPAAVKSSPIVARGMNSAEKIVFSRTLKTVDWNNSRLVKGRIDEEVRKLKEMPGKGMAILGSGSIVTQLAEHGLIDDYQIMVNPIAIGGGASLFKGLTKPLELKLTSTRVFKNGIVLLCYEPADRAPGAAQRRKAPKARRTEAVSMRRKR